MLTLSLEKPGGSTPKLQLSLTKGARFAVTVTWECEHAHLHDIDLHALEARNGGTGAKVDELSSILSTYNIESQGWSAPDQRRRLLRNPERRTEAFRRRENARHRRDDHDRRLQDSRGRQ